jgi:hypothetical protein
MRREQSGPVELVVSSSFVLDGKIVTKGKLVAVDEAAAKDLLRRGKAVIAGGTSPPKVLATSSETIALPPPSELDKLTKAELLEMAKDLGLEAKASDTKAELIAALESAAK